MKGFLFHFLAASACCLFLFIPFRGNSVEMVEKKGDSSVALLKKVTGTVFNDTDKNGVLDKGEQGVNGVCVTDGYNVVVTDAKGRYQLPVDKRSRFIYISVPSGYEVTERFYVKVQEIEGKTADFSLEQVPNQPSRFIHVSDTEARIYKDWVDLIKDYVDENEVAFIMFSGDICYTNGLKMHRDYLNTKMLGTTALFSVGNHDLVDGDYGEQLYEECFGPSYYSFNVGGVHFVSFPVLYGDRKPSYTPDQLYSWLKKDLSVLPKGTPFIFIDHHLIGYNTDFNLVGEKDSIDLKDYNMKGYLYGHYHLNLANKTPDGVQMYSSMSPNKGGIEHSPASFRVIEFDRQGNMNSEIRYANLNNHLVATVYPASDNQMRVRGIIYNSACDVTEAYVYCVPSAGRKGAIQQYPLYNTGTEMEWNGSIAFDFNNPANNGKWYVVAEFANGDVKKQRIDFDLAGYGKSTPLPGTLQIEWAKTAAPVHFAAPLIVGDTLFIAASDDDANVRCGIYAYDKNTGECLWFCKTENSIRNNIAWYKGAVYACDLAHNCYRVDAGNGKILWQKKLQKGLHTAFTQGICIDNGVLYAGHAASLTALDALTGEVIWKNSHWSGGVNTITTNVVADGVLITAGSWKGRFAHDAKTGAFLWGKTDDDTRNVTNTPIFYNGVFIYCNPTNIVEVEPRTGTVLKSAKLNATMNNASKGVVYKNLLLQGTSDKGLVALDMDNGYKEKWSFKINPALIYTAAYTKDFQMTIEGSGVVVDGVYYFGANDGFIYGVNAEMGTFVSRLNLGVPIIADVVYNDGFLYATDLTGGVYKLKIIR